MEHRVLLRLCAVRAAGFAVRALEELSLDEPHLDTRDKLEHETFGWNLGTRLNAETNLERFPARKVSEGMEEISKTTLVEVMR